MYNGIVFYFLEWLSIIRLCKATKMLSHSIKHIIDKLLAYVLHNWAEAIGNRLLRVDLQLGF